VINKSNVLGSKWWTLEDYLEKGTTINKDTYSDLIKNKLKPKIRSKRRGLLSTKVNDNAHPHTAHKTVETIKNIGFELLTHPPYSPDLAPSDY